MTVDNQKNQLNARIAVLVFSIVSLALIAYKVILLVWYESAITPSACIAEALSALPKLLLILYTAFLCKGGRAKILPFILFIVFAALHAFTVMGSGYDVLNWLSKEDALSDNLVREHIGAVILSALVVIASVLLIIGCWKSFSKPVFSILPICILLLSAAIAVGYYGFFAIKSVIEQISGTLPAYDAHEYVLSFVENLSGLFFHIAIGLFVLKNRSFTVRSASAEEATE
ncbi:MAG: hypothetical protein IJR88_06785 [Clostridia bacterium]|nr:hypothetical protein [Clostridia bacterium]